MFIDNVPKSELSNFDYRFFYGTEGWDLADACRDNDTVRIEKLLKETGLNVNFQEPIHGYTVLHCALRNNDFDAVKVLLREGADPNLFYTGHDGYQSNAMSIYGTSSEIYQLLLDYGGNPNSKYGHNSPVLSFWIYYNKEIAMQLLAAGANINIDTAEHVTQPIVDAIYNEQMDIALYLLEHGAWYDERARAYDGKNLIHLLREKTFEIGSEEHQAKMKVVEFLQERGYDYWSYPIPNYMLEYIKKEYPTDWEEYCKKY